MQKKALLLVGSPKPNESTSEVLGDYILKGLQKNEFKTEKISLRRVLNAKKGSKDLFKAVNEADLIIFSSTLYVDSTPAIVIKAMELITENRQDKKELKKQSMMAISNSGFIEI